MKTLHSIIFIATFKKVIVLQNGPVLSHAPRLSWHLCTPSLSAVDRQQSVQYCIIASKRW